MPLHPSTRPSRLVILNGALLSYALPLLLGVTWVGCNARTRAPLPATTAQATAERPQPAAPPTSSVAARDEQRPHTAGRGTQVFDSALETEDERNTIKVFEQAAASTVFVTQKKIVVDYFRGKATEVPAGSGSGFIWDKQGHVVTNFHVVKGAQSLTVTLYDHRTFKAEVVGTEKRKDIAVLKLIGAPGDLTPILLRKKALQLRVGQKTVAIGNPFGLDQTLTTGIISALGREVPGIGDVRIRDMVQTDAAINPGNSGGPLLDSAARLIGMNTMIFSRSGSSSGIGFAVPATTIQRVVPQIVKTGKAEQVGLGVEIDPAQRIERRLDIKGVIVLRVTPGGPAARAGLMGIQRTARGITLGDVIVGINKQAVEDYDDLYNILDQLKAGSKAQVTVIRKGKRLDISLELVLLR